MATLYLTEDKIKDIQSLYVKVLNDEDYKANTKAINKIFITMDASTQEYVKQIMKTMWKNFYK